MGVAGRCIKTPLRRGSPPNGGAHMNKPCPSLRPSAPSTKDMNKHILTENAHVVQLINWDEMAYFYDSN
jgi:hypothetical protein